MDRISNLHESLIVHILEELPLSDRVKTSSLSTQWRFLWTEVQSLAFDENFYDLICDIKSKPVSEYLHIINSVVLQCSRNARDVTLYIPLEDLEPNEDDLLDNIIKRFLSDGVERFYLLDEGPIPFCLSDYHLCPTISSTGRLTHLKLENCKFCPPSSSSQFFPSLISFDLNSTLVSASVISRFISSCPKLRKIVVWDLDSPQEYLDINAPELRDLFVQGGFKWLRLTNTENIEALTVRMDSVSNPWSSMHREISGFFDTMAKLEKITLGGQFLQLLALHDHTLKLAAYDRLKSLEFELVQLDVNMLMYMWEFITSISNLTTLYIWQGSDCCYNGIDPEQIRYMDYPEDAFKHLLKVDYQLIGGINIGMKIIELLLRVSTSLRVMSIRFQIYRHSRTKWPWHVRFCCIQKLSYFEKIMKFFRASSSAMVNIYVGDKLVVTKESDVMEVNMDDLHVVKDEPN